MKFINSSDIQFACAQFARDPIKGKAARLIDAIRDIADSNSDGWCYWRAPVNACKQLMLILENDAPSESQLRKAYGPVKSFCTKHKFQFPGE